MKLVNPKHFYKTPPFSSAAAAAARYLKCMQLNLLQRSERLFFLLLALNSKITELGYSWSQQGDASIQV
jgi:hypothetical protein